MTISGSTLICSIRMTGLIFWQAENRQAIDSYDDSGHVHMIPRQLIAPGQLTDPWVNFASVHCLMPVTVHMSFSLPRDNFKRLVTRCTTPGNPPCRDNFSPCEQNAKVAPGKSSLAQAHSVNVHNKFLNKKVPESTRNR